jgi:DNA-3-methyladenine glycosylase
LALRKAAAAGEWPSEVFPILGHILVDRDQGSDLSLDAQMMMLGSPLPRAFFVRPPDEVARELLGKLVIRRHSGEPLAGRIVEAEAYFGADDPAAHAFAGRTARTEVLFGPPGHAYVYLVYGMHYCLNVSCEPEGQAGCVLIRALEPVAGLAVMAAQRGLAGGSVMADGSVMGAAVPVRLLASGPGRLCQALGITRPAHNGLDVCDAGSELVFAEDGLPLPDIEVGPRIGIRKAVDRPARFWVRGNSFVSC